MKKYHKNNWAYNIKPITLFVMFVCVVLLVYLGAFVGGLVCNVFKVLSGSSLC